jgi:hypothetical protein
LGIDVSADISPLNCPHSFDFGILLEAAFSRASDDTGDLDDAKDATQDEDRGSLPPEGPSAKRQRRNSFQAPVPEKSISRQHVKRRLQRTAASLLTGQLQRSKTVEKYVQPAIPLLMFTVTEKLPATSCGYHGTPCKLTDAQTVYGLGDLLRLGFELVSWDGR